MATASTLINFRVTTPSPDANPTASQESEAKTEETVISTPNTGSSTKNQDGSIALSLILILIAFCVIIVATLIAVLKTGRSAKSSICISKKKRAIASFVTSFVLITVASGALISQIFNGLKTSASGEGIVFNSAENLNLEIIAGESGYICEELKVVSATPNGFKIQSTIANNVLTARDSETNKIVGEISSVSATGTLSENTWGFLLNSNSGTIPDNSWQPISTETEIFSTREETPSNSIVKVCYGIKTSADLAPGDYGVTIDYEATAYEMNLTGLYRTNLREQKNPKNLIILLMNYNNGYYAISDEEIEAEWHDWVFGTGNIENETASINDYLKEISNGQFYYNPILIGDNTTGVYSFHFDKDYTDDQGLHPEYDFFEFDYDLAQAMSQLADRGLDPSRFQANGINNSNYSDILTPLWNAPQSLRDPQWYDTDTILCVFPAINTSKVDIAPISNTFDKFAVHVHLNSDDGADFGTIAHELLHTIGTIDIYNFGSYADIMSDAYKNIFGYTYNTVHVNPYYKILFGWADAEVISSSQRNLTLYPTTSDKYNPVIVKTDDPNQYFILENRQAESFDHGVSSINSVGLNVWRIDGLAMDKIYRSNERRGLSARVLRFQGDSYTPMYYENKTDVNDDTEITTNITIDLISTNADGSITVSVDIP